MRKRVLTVEDLRVALPVPAGTLHAVQGVSFHVDRGETLCIVGESGCGKSLTALAIMDLLPAHAERTAARLELEGQSLIGVGERAMSDIRGNRMAMIFQEPMTSLNPAYSIGDQLQEALLRHKRVSRREARARAIELLERVGITAAGSRLKQYPHQLSGGLRQRVMIAMALMCQPALILADEPTTALDVTIQAQILHLLARVAAGVCHGAGADHPRSRHRRPHRHPRRRHVRRGSRGSGKRIRRLLGTSTPLYAWTACLHPRAWPHAPRRTPGHHSGPGPVARWQHRRLSFCATLSPRP